MVEGVEARGGEEIPNIWGMKDKQNHIGLISTEGWQKLEFLTYCWEQLEGSQPQKEVEDARAQSQRSCLGLRLREKWRRGTQRAR